MIKTPLYQPIYKTKLFWPSLLVILALLYSAPTSSHDKNVQWWECNDRHSEFEADDIFERLGDIYKRVSDRKKYKNRLRHWHNRKRRKQTGIFTLQNLSFQNGITGFNQTIITRPDDFNAAVFEATGDPWAVVTIYVKQNKVKMVNVDSRGKKRNTGVTIRDFITGGNIESNGRGVFNRQGFISNIRVGASVNIYSKAKAGRYKGKATIRLVYR